MVHRDERNKSEKRKGPRRDIVSRATPKICYHARPDVGSNVAGIGFRPIAACVIHVAAASKMVRNDLYYISLSLGKFRIIRYSRLWLFSGERLDGPREKTAPSGMDAPSQGDRVSLLWIYERNDAENESLPVTTSRAQAVCHSKYVEYVHTYIFICIFISGNRKIDINTERQKDKDS